MPANFGAEAEFQTYERFVARIPDARIVGENGFVILPDGQFAFEYITHHEAFIRCSPVYFQRISTAGRRRMRWAGSYFSVLGTFCGTYYHWMHDVLTQFHRVLEYLPPETRIVVPANLSQTQKETLRVLGICEERLAYLHPQDEVTVEQLYFIPPPTVTRFDEQESTQWLRGKLIEGLGVESPSKSRNRRILISRNKAGCRRILNEQGMDDSLKMLNFEKVQCEDLSFAEQSRLFNSAEAVVAPHGAGLTNLLFCRPSTKVLEIFPFNHTPTHYWSMSQALGLDYGCLLGDAIDNGAAEPNICISLDKLQAGLRMMGIR